MAVKRFFPFSSEYLCKWQKKEQRTQVRCSLVSVVFYML